MEMVSGDLRQKTGRVGRPGDVTITLEHSGNKKIGLKKNKADLFYGERKSYEVQSVAP